MADIQLPQTLAASVLTPPASSWTFFMESGLAVPCMKNSASAYTPLAPFGSAATLAASAAINTALTTITPSFKIPAGCMQAGSTYRVRIWGTCTSTVANASTFTLRIGNTGGTGDTAVCTVVPTAAASGTTIPFHVEFEVTCRSTGAGGSVMGGGKLVNSGVTGISAAASVLGGVVATAAVNTTIDNFISVSYSSAATTTTSTFQIAIVEIVKA